MVRMGMTLVGEDRIRKKLDGRLFTAPTNDTLDKLGKLGLTFAQKRAPVRPGEDEGALKSGLQLRKGSGFVEVFVNLTNRGFRYPEALQYKTRYHYRAGPRKGKSTKGWLSGVLPILRRQLRVELRQAAAHVQSVWGRR